LKLEKIQIRNIRNLESIEIRCGRGIHFIHGENAQGKTSILESVSVLSNLKSFRDSRLENLLRIGTEAGQVRGVFDLGQGTQATLKVDLVRTQARFEKRAFINEKLAKSALDYFGVKLNHSPIQFHAITLNPTSTDLIRGEPSLRRSYLNQVISSENPAYLETLKLYQKALDQKNALLKQEGRLDPSLLDILNLQLARSGAEIIHHRLEFLSRIQHPTQNFLDQIAPHQRPIQCAYKQGETLKFTGHFELPSIQILMENLQQKLTEKGVVERLRKTSLVGPHRDDFQIKVGGSSSPLDPDLVDVGSQGEIRSVLLALKLTELEEFEKRTGVQPVLLIDDFSSELDSTRRGFLLNYLEDSRLQIFMTSTDDLIGNLGSRGKSIRMNQGRIETESH
jgi:DNA replication and repair protein RecF